MAKTKTVDYAAAILDRVTKADADRAADLGFYTETLWKICEGTASETEQAAFEVVAAQLAESVDVARDRDVVKKLIDWRRSGHEPAGSPKYAETVQQMSQEVVKLKSDLAASEQSTGKIRANLQHVEAKLGKYQSRGEQWLRFETENPSLFAR
jgi:hypothetical protein